METLIINPLLQDQLKRLTELTLLTDQSGTPLGHFMPGVPIDPELYRLAESQCPFSADELRHMRQQSGGKSLSDIWQTVGER